jgi:hypothetical protein
MTVLAAGFPDNSGYVVAAYLVFFALLVIYLAITAFRLVNIEKQLTDLTQQLDDAERENAAAAPARVPEPTRDPVES